MLLRLYLVSFSSVQVSDGCLSNIITWTRYRQTLGACRTSNIWRWRTTSCRTSPFPTRWHFARSYTRWCSITTYSTRCQASCSRWAHSLRYIAMVTTTTLSQHLCGIIRTLMREFLRLVVALWISHSVSPRAYSSGQLRPSLAWKWTFTLTTQWRLCWKISFQTYTLDLTCAACVMKRD